MEPGPREQRVQYLDGAGGGHDLADLRRPYGDGRYVSLQVVPGLEDPGREPLEDYLFARFGPLVGRLWYLTELFD